MIKCDNAATIVSNYNIVLLHLGRLTSYAVIVNIELMWIFCHSIKNGLCLCVDTTAIVITVSWRWWKL